jgi:hypothetical protein
VDTLYLSVPEKSYNPKQQIYPNPATNRISVYINEGVKSLEIFDLAGKRVKSFKIQTQGLATFDISCLKPAVYIVKTAGNSFLMVVN